MEAIDTITKYTRQVEQQIEDERRQYGPGPPINGSPFRFLSASEICSEPRATDWIVRDILDGACLAMCYGEPESGKSFCGIDLGLSVAAGRESWHGHQIAKQGSVFYIPGEGHAGIARRLRAWALYNETDLRAIPFYTSDRPARFLDSDGGQEVCQAMEGLLVEHEAAPVLVIVDTLNRNFGPGDENSTRDMTSFVSVIDKHIRSRFHCAVLIIHHSGLAAKDRARGASALRAALDWEYSLMKSVDGTRTLTCTKSKDHDHPNPIYLTMNIVTLDGDEETSCVFVDAEKPIADTQRLSGAKKIALEALLSIGETYVHIDTWKDAAYQRGISTSTKTRSKYMAFRRAVSDLLDAELVKVKGDYYWAGNA